MISKCSVVHTPSWPGYQPPEPSPPPRPLPKPGLAVNTGLVDPIFSDERGSGRVYQRKRKRPASDVVPDSAASGGDDVAAATGAGCGERADGGGRASKSPLKRRPKKSPVKKAGASKSPLKPKSRQTKVAAAATTATAKPVPQQKRATAATAAAAAAAAPSCRPSRANRAGRDAAPIRAGGKLKVTPAPSLVVPVARPPVTLPPPLHCRRS